MNRLTSGGSSRDLKPGETRTIYDPKSDRTWTVLRTERDYIFDLCDAYNAELSERLRHQGLEWFVTPQKTLALGTTPGWDKQRHKRSVAALRTIDRAAYDVAAE